MTETESQKELEVHEAANFIPVMSEKEYNAVKSDIAAHGLREPIELYQGKIIDGRNRYRMCRELGIEPATKDVTEEVDKQGDPYSYVFSKNVSRRHLSSSQRAMFAIDANVKKHLASEAQARMKAGRAADPEQIFAQGRTADKIAALVGTNRQYIIDAEKIAKHSSVLADKVRQGELTIAEAVKQIPPRMSAPTQSRTPAQSSKSAARNIPSQSATTQRVPVDISSQPAESQQVPVHHTEEQSDVTPAIDVESKKNAALQEAEEAYSDVSEKNTALQELQEANAGYPELSPEDIHQELATLLSQRKECAELLESIDQAIAMLEEQLQAVE